MLLDLQRIANGQVFMDYTHIPGGKWDRYPMNLFPKQRFNFKEKPFQIAHVAHLFMGGVKIKPSGETDIQGLFAAGKAASGVHGANRLGGNTLTECLVFGANSGLPASENAEKHLFKKSPFNLGKWLKSLMRGRMNLNTQKEIFNLLKRIREIGGGCVGPIRNEVELKDALSLLEGVDRYL